MTFDYWFDYKTSLAGKHKPLVKLAWDAAIQSERKACYAVVQDALRHAGLDLTTIDYIAGNIKARGL